VYWLHDSRVVAWAVGTTDPLVASYRRILRAAGLGETAARNGRTDRGVNRRAASGERPNPFDTKV
jgi:hypothetical protein